MRTGMSGLWRSSTATALCIGSQVRPVQRSVCTARERVELAGVADEQGAVEQAGDAQQQVRAHLVGLVDDRPRPGSLRADRSPLVRGAEHHQAAGQVGRASWRPSRADAGPRGPRGCTHSRRAGRSPGPAVRRPAGRSRSSTCSLVCAMTMTRSPAVGEVRRGAHDQRRLARTGRGVDDHTAVGRRRGSARISAVACSASSAGARS